MRPPEAQPSAALGRLVGGLDAVVRRLRAADWLDAVARAAAAGALVVVAAAAARASARTALALSTGAVVAAAAALIVRRRRAWTRARAAQRLEQVRPESRNLIVTAEELLRSPREVRSPIVHRVVRHAAEHVSGASPGDVVPLGRPAILCAVALVAWLAAVAGVPERAAIAVRDAAVRTGLVPQPSPGPLRLSAILEAPEYLRVPVEELQNPERLQAVAGTRLSLTIAGGDHDVSVRLGSTPLETTRTPEGVNARVILRETTYLVVEAAAREQRRLVPVVVTPDRAPAIRIEQPGKDLLLPDAAATIPVAATATDDFALASLELRFTKVSGSGEQFEFEEGTVPLQLTRDSERAWTGRAALVLPQMNLQPGDSVVYRVVGADRRPGQAGIAASDTFFVEVAGPDQVTLAGFELPPDRERYALSQQMILLKIQRLRARQPSMAREEAAEEAAAIAVEQRSVRANFVFLTGGHVEDEEEEAAHSHEIQEGRLAHTARQEINAAIQHMSRVEQALVAGDIGAALPPARAAVEALQRAFGRNRYLLRTLPVRSRLDPSRRLSGERDEAEDWRREIEASEAAPGAVAAREILTGLLDLAPAVAAGPGTVDAARLTILAERALAVDAGSEEWQQISRTLMQLRESIAGGGERAEIRAQLAKVIRDVRAESHRDAVPPLRGDRRDPRMRGAWADRVGR